MSGWGCSEAECALAAAVSVWGVVKADGERWAEREHSAESTPATATW